MAKIAMTSDKKIMVLNEGVEGIPSITIDSELSDTSTNPVQNKVIKAAIDAVRQLSEDVGIPAKLEAIKEEDLDFLAKSAHADACAPGNPKDASVEDLKGLFRKVM